MRMAVFTSNGTGGGAWNVAASWTAGVSYPQAGDSAIIVNGDVITINSGAEACYDIDIQAGGNLTLDCVLSGIPQTLTFDDTAAAGFKASAGTLVCNGTATDAFTITSASGDSPTNYWDFYCTTLSVTATYGTFNAYSKVEFQAGSTINITNCTFSNTATGAAARAMYFNGATINAFDDNTFDNCAGAGSLVSVTTHVFDGITINPNCAGEDVLVSGVTDVHFTNSSFDPTTCAISNAAGATLTSEDHDGTPGDFVIVLRDTPEVDFTEFANEPGGGDDIYLYLEDGAADATMDFDEQDKTFGSLNINTGEAITVKVSQTGIKFKGGFSEAYKLGVTAAGELTFDATAAAGAGAAIEIEAQSNSNVEIDVDAGGAIYFKGEPGGVVTISEKGVGDTTAPTNGIGIAASQGTWALAYTRFYHVRQGSLSNLFSGVLSLTDSTIMFEVGTAPEEVTVTGANPGDLDGSNLRIASYDEKKWYLNPLSSASPGTVIADIYHSFFDNCLPSIWEPTGKTGVVFFQPPMMLRTVLPSVIEGSAVGEYVGGDNVPVERTHESNLIIKVAGVFNHHAPDPYGQANGHPGGWRYYYMLLEYYYTQEEKDLVFVWSRGSINSAQITELKQDHPAGSTDEYTPIPYAFIIEGSQVIAPPA